MLTILKYPIELSGYFEITMPEGSKLLSVTTEGIAAYLYAMVDTSRINEQRSFSVCVTAAEINSRAYTNLYVGSCVISGNGCHLFEASKSQ